MKIFFDARYIRTDFHDGISRYCTELGNALATLTPVTFIISDPAQRKFLPAGAETVQIHPVTSPKEPFTSIVLNKYHPDIVISPLQTMGSIGRRFKLVLTLHDLIYYKHRTPPPQYNAVIRFGWWLYHLTYLPQRMALNGADVVATVSQTSRDEILEARLTKRPVIVVSNAARDLSTLLDTPAHIDGSIQHLIYMGAFIPYKNAETLIKSMQWLPGKTLHLLSRISTTCKAELTKLIPEGANVVFHNGVDDKEYAELLADNAVAVSASKAEGFGLPLAEALHIGVPAVVSDMAIFHEVAGAGALYADPDNPRDFAAKVTALDDKELREQLIAAGQEHVAQFSWNESARILYENIKSM